MKRIRAAIGTGQKPEANALVVIGASTGGPKAVKVVLSALPPDLPAAVLIVQHLSEEFTDLVAAGIRRASRVLIEAAAEGAVLREGSAYLAPGGVSVSLAPSGRGAAVRLVDRPSPHRIQPWIDLAMTDAAKLFKRRCVAVLLTGMGEDGMLGMKAVKSHGGVTFAQDEASSLIFGMAREAIRAGVVDHVLPSDQIGAAVSESVDALGRF